MYDPSIGDGWFQGQYPVVPFVRANNVILNINQTELAHLEKMSSDCGVTAVSILL